MVGASAEPAALVLAAESRLRSISSIWPRFEDGTPVMLGDTIGGSTVQQVRIMVDPMAKGGEPYWYELVTGAGQISGPKTARIPVQVDPEEEQRRLEDDVISALGQLADSDPKAADRLGSAVLGFLERQRRIDADAALTEKGGTEGERAVRSAG